MSVTIRRAVETDALALHSVGLLGAGELVWLPAEVTPTHTGYPHPYGFLGDCNGCMDQCYCTGGTVPCVYCTDLLEGMGEHMPVRAGGLTDAQERQAADPPDYTPDEDPYPWVPEYDDAPDWAGMDV